MVLTTRHHEGFSVFDTKADGYSSVQSACKRDLVAEYVESCRRHGLRINLYDSLMDWTFRRAVLVLWVWIRQTARRHTGSFRV